MLFQLLRGSSLWHADRDSNLVASKPELYQQLAEWSVAGAKEAVSSEPNRWAQVRSSSSYVVSAALLLAACAE